MTSRTGRYLHAGWKRIWSSEPYCQTRNKLLPSIYWPQPWQTLPYQIVHRPLSIQTNPIPTARGKLPMDFGSGDTMAELSRQEFFEAILSSQILDPYLERDSNLAELI